VACCSSRIGLDEREAVRNGAGADDQPGADREEAAVRLRHRRDHTHVEVVKALKAIGCDVLDTSQGVSGNPDLIVGLRQRTFAIEIKSKGGKETPAQAARRSDWTGDRWFTVHSATEAIEAVLDALRG